MANIIQSHWEHSPVICELNGYRWYLGPEAEEGMSWKGVKSWCHSVGGDLPPKDILFQCYLSALTKVINNNLANL